MNSGASKPHSDLEQMMSEKDLTRLAIPTVSDEDTPLVVAIQAGDEAAFEQLVSRYDGKLFRTAHHIVHNTEDARDVVQETFIKVFQNIGQFQSQAKFSTWVYRIVVNQCLMHIRRQRGKSVAMDSSVKGSEEEQLPLDLSDWRPNPEEQYTESELRELLTRLLQNLPPALRVVFIMHDIEEQSLQEVADALDLSLSAVKTRALRARLYLRERLTRHFKNDIDNMRAREHRLFIPQTVANDHAAAHADDPFLWTIGAFRNAENVSQSQSQ
jgi:RNA polymerase sigma-70 factor (ECF subfamily)